MVVRVVLVVGGGFTASKIGQGWRWRVPVGRQCSGQARSYGAATNEW